MFEDVENFVDSDPKEGIVSVSANQFNRHPQF